jgi:hypothetical protein
MAPFERFVEIALCHWLVLEEHVSNCLVEVEVTYFLGILADEKVIPHFEDRHHPTQEESLNSELRPLEI